MRTNVAGRRLIREFEGLELYPYPDAKGILTIGFGHVILAHESHLLAGITEAEAESLLDTDLAIAESAVKRLVTCPLNENQFAALVSFVFNLGAEPFKKSTLRRKLNAGDPIGAAGEFERWVYAGARRLPGLERRRKAERLLFERPIPSPLRGVH